MYNYIHAPASEILLNAIPHVVHISSGASDDVNDAENGNLWRSLRGIVMVAVALFVTSVFMSGMIMIMAMAMIVVMIVRL